MNSTHLIDIHGREISLHENCSICLEKLDNNKYQIQECKHEFHSGCLLTFFRTGNTSCPLCRSTATHNNTLRTVLNYSKKENANKTIVNMVKKYKILKQVEETCKREFLEYNKKYKDIFKMRDKLYTKRWKSSRKLKISKCNLSNMVLQLNVIR